MRETITISLPEAVKRELDRMTAKEGLSRSEVVRFALDDFLFFRRFRTLRARLGAQAASRGIATDEDVFDRVS